MKLLTLAAAIAVASLSAADPAAPPSRLSVRGKGSPYVTGARSAIDVAAGEQVTFRVNSTGDRSRVNLTVRAGEDDWTLSVGTGSAAPLAVGAYSPAARVNVAGEKLATIDFSGCGRGSNGYLGSFEVREIRWGPNGTLAALAVDFTAYEDGQDYQVIWGALRYRSDVPVPDLKAPAPIPK